LSSLRPLGLRPLPVPEGFPGRVDFIKSARGLGDSPHTDMAEVCFCGRSNVGKSSLLNTLANRKQLARVSGTPGRTRLINFFDAQGIVTLADLPGYGWAKVTRDMQAEWGRTIQGYLADRPQLALALLLVDMRRDPAAEERQLLDWFRERDRSCLIVATKADKFPTSRWPGRRRDIARSLDVPTEDVVPFSALSREGRDLVWGTILALLADHAKLATGEAP
jgi:GTP-binding protein